MSDPKEMTLEECVRRVEQDLGRAQKPVYFHTALVCGHFMATLITEDSPAREYTWLNGRRWTVFVDGALRTGNYLPYDKDELPPKPGT